MAYSNHPKDLLALYLDSNILDGTIPKSISLLTSLVDLRLRANKLTGSIPTELGALRNLEVCTSSAKLNEKVT